ncbi:MAG: hypothetical protein ACLFPQ_00825 [Candidatus Woesearchaeota archaeon]
MSASIDQKSKEQFIIWIARKMIDAVEGITKSKEVSKEFYLLATKIQDETQDMQRQIIWTAAKLFSDFWFENKINENSEFDFFIKCIDEAYEQIKGNKNE